MDFIRQCLKVSEETRISWDDLFKHPLLHEKNTHHVPPKEISTNVQRILGKVQ